MSPMEAGAEAATETTGEEMGAVLDQAKEVLTQMKTVIGPVVAARATDSAEAVGTVAAAATTTAEEVVPALARPAVIVLMTGSRAIVHLCLSETAVAMVLMTAG